LPQTIGDFKVDEYNGVLKTNTDVLKYGTYRMTGWYFDIKNSKIYEKARVLSHNENRLNLARKKILIFLLKLSFFGCFFYLAWF
jgi:hypothetical protein